MSPDLEWVCPAPGRSRVPMECPSLGLCHRYSQFVPSVYKFLSLNHEFLNQDSFARKVWVCAKGSQIVLPVEKFLSLKREFGL